jgi:protein-S-isoprenylcysteine O-methyltransferase Ste14
MLGMLLAAVCWVGTLPGWPLAIVLFLAGTEIRVRVEDALLYERFGERFAEWQKAVPAYLPFVR